MSATIATVAYLGAIILFILSLGGLSNPESSRRGNLYGMVGMTIAVLATLFGPQVTPPGYPWIIGAMVVGASIGLYAARAVRMTQMPELVALMHSLVGLAAVLVGYANYIDPAATALRLSVLQSVVPLSPPGSGEPVTAICHSALLGSRLPALAQAMLAWYQVMYADGTTPGRLTA